MEKVNSYYKSNYHKNASYCFDEALLIDPKLKDLLYDKGLAYNNLKEY